MKTVKINSYAKVNLGLKVLNERSDGYHNISTIFQEIDLHDQLIISKNISGCQFSSNVNWLRNDQNNLCVIAYSHMKDLYNIEGIDIVLTKNISRGSGLGSGSSNAATVLKSISKIYDLNVSYEDLVKIGSKIGADVPFFIKGGTQIGEGIGEKLIGLKSAIKGWYLIITPDITIDTKWAYLQLKNILDNDTLPTKFSNLISEKVINLDTIKFFENDFESVVFPTYPEIGAIKKELFALGAKFASLSGSGSTVFGIFDDNAKIKKAFSHFHPIHKAHIAHSI